MTNRSLEASAGRHASDGDRTVDVVVCGSGAAALTAATLARDAGADVVVLERSDEIGGTSAVSGGVMWIPGNHHMCASPEDRSRDVAEARRYIDALAECSGTATVSDREEVLDGFLGSAPDALAYLERTTPVRTAIVEGLADYYESAGLPGARATGRSVEPLPYPARGELGTWADRLARRGTLLSLGAVTTLGEDLSRASRAMTDELQRRELDDVRTKGAALVAMLVRGLLDRRTAVETGTRVIRVVAAADGAADGVIVERDSHEETIRARLGVILACGGYEWDRALVAEHVGYDVEPLTPPNNVGDGLRMARQLGAELASIGSYWGQPAMFDPTVRLDGAPVPQFEWARGAPSSLVVDHTGKRFANEALPYHEFSKRIGARGAPPGGSPSDRRSWLIFDQRVKDTMRILSVTPGDAAPEWLARGGTTRELARRIGVPADELDRTVDRFNHHAAEGRDPDFGRTVSGITGPGRVAEMRPPFYAVPLHPGTIGTNGGVRTDMVGRVIREGGGVINGLYAVGNTAASPIGDIYPGAGATLGPAVTLGYLAGRHVTRDIDLTPRRR